MAGESLQKALDKAVPPEYTITAEAPFAGSKAETFGDGAAAIVPPEAVKAGAFSRKDVAVAYRTAKKMLVAAYLDRVTLQGGKPQAFARLLGPEQRKDFLKNLDHKDQNKNSRGEVASFAKGQAELVGDVIKVQGKMSAKPRKGDDGGAELRVTYEYRFVYAVRKPGTGMITRVMAYDKGAYDFWRDAPGGPLQHWWMGSDERWQAGVECEPDDGFIRPTYPDAAPTGVQPSGPVQDAYGEGESSDEDCGSVGDI
ncbi:hypothetical protein DP939_11630 [Spongiactinospora rosea]|uniref:Uncharacterized protein n=1 Tax=Spongiactinospora rosea TaxID=2248750 RepID=A0A366M2L0_9ACTN|nr:hypothetical protein DP939_11630 [Spongiactinospora rosea]